MTTITNGLDVVCEFQMADGKSTKGRKATVFQKKGGLSSEFGMHIDGLGFVDVRSVWSEIDFKNSTSARWKLASVSFYSNDETQVLAVIDAISAVDADQAAKMRKNIAKKNGRFHYKNTIVVCVTDDEKKMIEDAITQRLMQTLNPAGYEKPAEIGGTRCLSCGRESRPDATYYTHINECDCCQ